MSAQHTPVKLVAKVDFSTPPTPDEVEGTYYRIRAGKKLVALVPHVWQGGRTPLTLAHMTAIRLAACWNACEGITTERLEDLGRPLMQHLIGCDERAARQVKEAEDLTAQRDELLAALKEADEDFELEGFDPDGAYRKHIRDAIAKATGGKSMSTKDTGGPAFPVADPFVAHQPDTVYEAIRLAEGMTLRDYFAAKAMAALISTSGGPCIVGGLSGAEPETAKAAYNIADAMLKARGA